MLAKTHLVITLFLVLMLFSNVQNFWLFVPVCLIATLLPDIDSRFSAVGKHKIFRIVNFFTKHRGMFHSFSFLLAVSVILFVFFRAILLPFAFGYATHLILDALTLSGVRIFYPLKFRARGIIKTGGIIEKTLFLGFFIADLYLVSSSIYDVF